jgi:NAD(P)-dependent dehydrogenase (short-subunit alcohol dehydrogenase family)
MDLTGRGAIVTGGGRGIGEAVAKSLAAAGARVLVAARSLAEVERVAHEIRDANGDADFVQCDVADAASVARLVATAAERLATVDILVNNAGVASSAPLARITLEEWNRVFAVNVTGTMLCTQAFVPAMVARRWGRVINIASVASRAGAPYIATYATSKHAVLGFTRCVAAEVAASGVTVNAVCPGYVDTPMTDWTVATIQSKTRLSHDEALAALLKTTPQGRLLSVSEVAYAALALCAEEARGINGQAIVIDGGALLS